jgi:diguanylate cyclase (GGDEF)-like protein
MRDGGGPDDGPPVLDGPVLDRLLPMHVRLGPDGAIRHAGPTFRQMCGGGAVLGRPLFDLLDVRRPAAAQDVAGLTASAGQRLILALAAAPDLPLRGVAATLPRGGGVLLDLSLGLSFERAVERFGLTVTDFSPCDQTVELLYLHEANAAIGRLSRQLTERLSLARADAEARALTDPLTGLANRRAMDAELSRCLADPQADFSLLHVDLDHFKQVNDTHGHAAGDRVLVEVAGFLRDQTRNADMAARVGGDEFLVLMRGIVARDALAATAGRLIRRIETPVDFEGAQCRVSASVGIAPSDAYRARPTARRLMSDADAALYRAKKAGRGRFAIRGRRAAQPRPAALRG